MNPLISPTSSIFLPLSQLNPHCTRLLNSLNDGRTSQKDKILLEQTLWNEVKKIRALNDTSIFLYLIGYYHVILYQIAKLSAQNDLFQYHVLIRLGDLNRYIDRTDVAEYYYCNARNLFPCFGHAYNQLGLLTKPTNCYKCCYYYARAAKSSDKPLNTIADSNLRIAVSKYDCEILNYILNDEACISISDGPYCNKLPTSAFEWFYIIVVAIYADNIQPITKSFLSYINEALFTLKGTATLQSVETSTRFRDRSSYILLSNLDMLLDWLKMGSQSKVILPAISAELRQMKSHLQSVILSLDVSNMTVLHQSTRSKSNSDSNTLSTIMDASSSTRFSASLSNSNSTLQDSTITSTFDSSSKGSNNEKLPALPHDYILRGFSPLDYIHRDLDFKTTNLAGRSILDDNSFRDDDLDKSFIDIGQLLQLLLRIRSKIDGFGPLLRRKHTRNIALESILSNFGHNNEL